MANPRWWMDAGDETFSIIGKALDKADPLTDAVMRVISRRSKSVPGQPFYDPEQEIMQKFPANTWQAAMDRVKELRVLNNKDADVVTPWKWEGPRPGEMSGYDLSWQNSEALKQFDRAARAHKDAAGVMQRPKPFGRAWKDAYTWMSTQDKPTQNFRPFVVFNKKKARRTISRTLSHFFELAEKRNFPREWTGEAAVSLLRKSRVKADAQLAESSDNMAKIMFADTIRNTGLATIQDAEIAGVPEMTNRQRALFFELYPEWQEPAADLGDFVRLTTELD